LDPRTPLTGHIEKPAAVSGAGFSIFAMMPPCRWFARRVKL